MAHTLLVYHPEDAPEYARHLARAGYPGPVLTAVSTAELHAHLPAAEVLLAPWLPEPELPPAPRLRWIQCTRAGIEAWLGVKLPPKVIFTRCAGAFGGLMAEYTMAHILAHAQGIRRIWQQQAARSWDPFTTVALQGKTLGIAGMGDIGGEVARRARPFGLRIHGLNRSGRPHPLADRTFPIGALAEFMAGLDFLAVVLPLTPATRGLLDAAAFAAARPGLVLVNIGRGATIDDDALRGALDSGRVAHAILDVFATEPLPPDHWMWSHPGVTVTPHMSGPSHPGLVTDVFMAQYRRFAAGEPLEGVVNWEFGY